MTTRDLSRLAKHVKARRLEVFPSRLVAAQAVGLSKDTWRRVEDGKPVRDATYARIEEALKWAPGSCLEITQGGVPALVDHVGEGDLAAMVVKPPVSWVGEDPEEVVRKAMANSALVTVPGLPIGDLQVFTDGVVRALRESGLIPPDSAERDGE